MSVWTDLLLAFFHDPPDKAARIPGHVSRTRRYLEAALDWKPSEAEAHGGLADQHASAIERLPMPDGEHASRQVGLEDDGHGPLFPVHPMSAAKYPTPLMACDIDESWLIDRIQRIVNGLPGAEERQRFLALWRLLPERLAADKEWFTRLPADTRTPDHTIWHHMDITAALAVAGSGGKCYLSFSLGPVQTFIATARTVRDLWTGSMILAWLTFQGMLPVIESHGPTALVYPSLRGVPLLDLWLRKLKGLESLVEAPDEHQLKSPCLPNRFLAVIPRGVDGEGARSLAFQCEKSVRDSWRSLCGAVHEKLAAELERHVEVRLREHWDRWWTTQVENFFDVRTALLPADQCRDETLAELLAGKSQFSEAFADAHSVRELASVIPPEHLPGFEQNTAGQWQHSLELSARLMEASKSVRHVPPPIDVTGGEVVPPKCSMLGSYEQMGPAQLEESANFWEQAAKTVRLKGVRLRKRERLSAVALVKRFAGPAFLAGELELSDRRLLRWDDTATVGAAEWLARAQAKGFQELDPEAIRDRHKSWSGQWLHGPSAENEDEDAKCPDEVRRWIEAACEHPDLGKPPAYYAVLMMDGDHLGAWLRGERSPTVESVMHPKMVDYYRGLRDAQRRALPQVEAALRARRPVGPALHAALSEALANFALHFVPRIVTAHHGTLVYAGGDDVLALLPTATALECASALNTVFRKDWERDARGRERLLMGRCASLSGGLVIVHHKEDLRFALEEARKAERRAKKAGRDALEIAVCRRSGEHASALCPWSFVPKVVQWVQHFRHRNVSDRWAYRLRAELPTLQGLSADIMKAEMKRQIQRAEDTTRSLFGSGDKTRAGDELAGWFEDYRSSQSPPDAESPQGKPRFQNDGQALAQFITLCQSASFLARGRDQ